MSKYVEEISEEKRNYESSKKIEERNRMLSKENGHSMFLNLCGIYSYYRDIEPEEALELKKLLKLDINIQESMSFINGYEKGIRLEKAGILESKIPAIEEKINGYLEMISKCKGKSH